HVCDLVGAATCAEQRLEARQELGLAAILRVVELVSQVLVPAEPGLARCIPDSIEALIELAHAAELERQHEDLRLAPAQGLRDAPGRAVVLIGVARDVAERSP